MQGEPQVLRLGEQLAVATPRKKCRAVNKHREEYDVLCTRPGPLGNPHPVGRPCPVPSCRGMVHPRGGAVFAFRLHFYSDAGARMRAAARRLLKKGDRLGCVCKPLECHCDVVAGYVNRGFKFRRTELGYGETMGHPFLKRSGT